MPNKFFMSDQHQVAFFNESGTYANQFGSAKWVGMVQSHESDEDMGVINARYLGTASRNVSQFLDGPKSFNNTLTFYPQDWQFLYFAMGKVTDGGSPSPYTHTITTAHGDNIDPTNGEILPSFQVEEFQGIGVTGSNWLRTFDGCMVNSLTITATQGEPVTCEVNYIAQDVTFASGAKSSVTATTSRPFMYQDLKVHLYASGTTVDEVKSVALTVNNNLGVNHYVDNNRLVGVPLPGAADYQIEVTLNATATHTKSLYDQYFVGGSTFNALFDFTASTGSRILYITCSGCKVLDMEAPSEIGDGPSEQTITIAPEVVTASATDDIQYYRSFSGA